MKRLFLLLAVGHLAGACPSSTSTTSTTPMTAASTLVPASPDVPLACQLTSPELQQRKATVLAHLKSQVLSRHELPNGFAYTFPGTDAMLAELVTFIQTERQCCGFFHFQLAVGDARQPTRLELTGPAGAKEMIRDELAL